MQINKKGLANANPFRKKTFKINDLRSKKECRRQNPLVVHCIVAAAADDSAAATADDAAAELVVVHVAEVDHLERDLELADLDRLERDRLAFA